jgi:ribonuclease HII
LSSNNSLLAETIPTLTQERILWQQGYRCIAGMDEAGRGAWAGPVVAAAVILPQGCPELADLLSPVRDSKLLAPHRRSCCYDLVLEHALCWAVGAVPAAEIDRIGIVPATRLAMHQALERLPIEPAYLLIDALQLDRVPTPQRAIIRGDRTCLSIAAASIIAKVTRDRLMCDLNAVHPGYGLAQHKGYGTPGHRQALGRLGSSPLHRHSFRPVALRNALDCYD